MNAALREFGRYGYAKTSAEQIAKQAGIAKGMVFHYFGSKLGMYEYLFIYSNQVIREYFKELDEQMKGLDFIEQYRYMTQIKLKAYTEAPYVFEFFTMVFTHPENLEISPKARAEYDELMRIREKYLAVVDSSNNSYLFRSDLNVKKAKRYIGWIMEGYAQNILLKMNGKPLADMELTPYWTEFDEILEDLKKIFYQTEL